MRQTILAFVALAGVSTAVFVVRTHAPSSASVAAARAVTPTPAQPAAWPKRAAPARPVRAQPAIVSKTVQTAVTPVAATAPRRAVTKHVERVRAPSRAQSLASAPSDESGSTRASADTPPPPPEPLTITEAQVAALSPSSARITWRTSLPARSQTAYGLDTPTVWNDAASSFGVDHASVLTGLSFSTAYTVWIHAVDEWDRAETISVSLTTAPMPDRTVARTSGGRILLDDQPFFARAVWEQCSDGYDQNIADGVNLFMGGGCGSRRALPSELAGRAYSVVDAKDADTNGRGVIGWYYPDEWDAYLTSGVTRNDLRTKLVEPRSGRISFLTLTNHFYSRAEPLPQGKGMYPTLLSIPDVVGFDLYPLQSWCRQGAFGDVFDSQHELQSVSGGKPTFQWIEVTRMEQTCASSGAFDPTPATVRAETWLAIGGGAAAIGYFPNRWSRPIGNEIARTNREIESLAPALLAPSVPVHSDAEGSLKVSARALNGALYVIAVNTTQSTIQAKVSLDGIAGRSVTALGGGTVVGADDNSFTDAFGPLDARVYVVPPQGW